MLFVFLIGSVVFYFILKSSTEKEIGDELKSRMEFIKEEISNKPENYGRLHIPGYISIERIEPEEVEPALVADTILLNHEDNTYKLYRTLRSDEETSGGIYRVVVYKSLVESNELIERIILIDTVIIILFILFLYLINRFMIGRVWSDFFQTLEKLRSFDVNSAKEHRIWRVGNYRV